MSDEIKKLKAEVEALKAQIGGLPAVREAEAVHATKEERKAKAARLQELKRIRPVTMEALNNEHREAEEKLREAQENLKKARGEFTITENRLFSEGWQIDSEIRSIEDFLYRSAGADLRRALQRAKDRLEESRSRPLETLLLPDIPTGVGVPFYDFEGNTRMSEGSPSSWWRKHVGATPRELREQEMDEIAQEIKEIETQILGGD
jgi:hypothetical protein